MGFTLFWLDLTIVAVNPNDRDFNDNAIVEWMAIKNDWLHTIVIIQMPSTIDCLGQQQQQQSMAIWDMGNSKATSETVRWYCHYYYSISMRYRLIHKSS